MTVTVTVSTLVTVTVMTVVLALFGIGGVHELQVLEPVAAESR